LIAVDGLATLRANVRRSRKRDSKAMMTIPNLLTLFRMAAIPALVVLTWLGMRTAFLSLLACSLFSDAIDGFIARKLNQQSEIGARLDTYADFTMYIIVPILALYLWTGRITREWPSVLAVFLCAIIPVIVGLAKFHRLPAYHTYGAKLSAVLMGVSAFFLFATGIAWPLHLSVPILFLTSVEELAITAILPKWHANIRTFREARRIAQAHPDTEDSET